MVRKVAVQMRLSVSDIKTFLHGLRQIHPQFPKDLQTLLSAPRQADKQTVESEKHG